MNKTLHYAAHREKDRFRNIMKKHKDKTLTFQHRQLRREVEGRSSELGYHLPGSGLSSLVDSVRNMLDRAIRRPIRPSLINTIRQQLNGYERAIIGEGPEEAHRKVGMLKYALDWVEDHAIGGLMIEPQYRRGRRDALPVVCRKDPHVVRPTRAHRSSKDDVPIATQAIRGFTI